MDELTTVLFYQSWYEAAGCLGEEKQIKATIQIIRYGLYGEVPNNDDDPAMKALMMSWMPLVDANKQKRKGGAPKGNQNAKGNKGGTGRPKKTQPKTQPFNVNANANGKVNANGNSNGNALPSVGYAAYGGAASSTSGAEPDWLRNDDE